MENLGLLDPLLPRERRLLARSSSPLRSFLELQRQNPDVTAQATTSCINASSSLRTTGVRTGTLELGDVKSGPELLRAPAPQECCLSSCQKEGPELLLLGTPRLLWFGRSIGSPLRVLEEKPRHLCRSVWSLGVAVRSGGVPARPGMSEPVDVPPLHDGLISGVTVGKAGVGVASGICP